MGYWTIRNGDLVAQINKANAQLCSLRHGDIEFLHGGGKNPEDYGPDELHPASWKQSEIALFPPGKAKSHLYWEPSTNIEYNIGQHGLPRHLSWSPIEQLPHGIRLLMAYRGEVVQNTKSLPHEEPLLLSWPYEFTIEKEFSLQSNALLTCFKITNQSVRSQPYAFGWHPAFKIPTGGFEVEVPDETTRPLGTGIDDGVDSTELTLRGQQYAINVTSDFGRLHLWRPKDAPMVCVEPLTAPMLTEGYESLVPPFGAVLAPHDHAIYTATIRPKIH